MKVSCTAKYLAALLFAFAGLPLAAQKPAAPDSTLYTTYTLFASNGQTTLDWVVCGATLDTSGCYDFGSIGPFTGVGAMIEGLPSVKGTVVTRFIYVVDSGSAAVTLYVYKKVDSITTTFDTTTVTLVNTIALPLTGGSKAICSMAANNGFLFIGTDQSPQGVSVNKRNLAVTQLGGFSPPINVTSITADEYGYVTVTQGDASGSSGFSLFGPTGALQEDGGGADFVLGTTQAISPSPALIGAAPTVLRAGYHFKTQAGGN